MISVGRSVPQKIRQQAREKTIKEVHASMKIGLRKDDILREIMEINPTYSLSAAQKLYKEAFIKLSSEDQLECLKKQRRAELNEQEYAKRELEKVKIQRK